MRLLLDELGDPEVTPDDWFEHYAILVERWLTRRWTVEEESCGVSAEGLYSRCKKFCEAYEIYAAKGSPQDLRHAPYVLTNWDSVGQFEVTMFIFKENNNGNTYRVVDG